MINDVLMCSVMLLISMCIAAWWGRHQWRKGRYAGVAIEMLVIPWCIRAGENPGCPFYRSIDSKMYDGKHHRCGRAEKWIIYSSIREMFDNCPLSAAP